MTAVLLDTHTWAWSLTDDPRLSDLLPAICLTGGTMDWHHRDPFDRLLAATALHYAYPLISADTVFDGIVERIW